MWIIQLFNQITGFSISPSKKAESTKPLDSMKQTEYHLCCPAEEKLEYYHIVLFELKWKMQINLMYFLYSTIFFLPSSRNTHIPGDRQTHKFKYCMPTSGEAAFRKASGDGLIDPLAKMGDIPPTSISIKPLRPRGFSGPAFVSFPRRAKKNL